MIVPATVLASARDILQDTVAGGYRYSDESLYRALNQAFLEAKRLRPDMYFVEGAIQPVPTVDASNVSTPVKVDDQFMQAFVVYVVGFVELRDDQYSQDGRAAAMLNQFRGTLLSV